MKGSLGSFHWIWNTEMQSEMQRASCVDIGGYFYLNEPHNDDLILLRRSGQPCNAGSIRTYSMLNDVPAYNTFDAGTISYNSGDNTAQARCGTVLLAARLYTPLVHLLKQHGALSLLDMPRSYRQAKLRLSQIDNFMTKYDAGHVATDRAVGRIRWEVRVSFEAGTSRETVLNGAELHVRWLLQYANPVAVPLSVYWNAITEYRAAA